KPQNVQPRIRAIDNVNIAAIIGGDIVRLDHLPAYFRIALIGATTKVGVLGHRGDEERNILWVVWIADIEGAHTAVEVRDKDDLLIEGRPEPLIRRVRAKAAAQVAKPALRRGDLRRGNRLRPTLGGDIGHKCKVAELGAEMSRCLGGYDHNVARGVIYVIDFIITGIGNEIRDYKPPERPGSVSAVVWVHNQLSELGSLEVGTRSGRQCRLDRTARGSCAPRWRQKL